MWRLFHPKRDTKLMNSEAIEKSSRRRFVSETEVEISCQRYGVGACPFRGWARPKL